MNRPCSIFIGPWRSLSYSQRPEILNKVNAGNYALLLMLEPSDEHYTTMECLTVLEDVYLDLIKKGHVRIRHVAGKIESINLC